MSDSAIQRRLTTILAADVVGYSRMTATAEEATLRVLDERVATLRQMLPRYGGRLFKTMGDGLLVEFASPVEAVRCAIEFQESMRTLNAPMEDDKRVRMRIGINLGDVTVRDDDLLGDGVNIAARLQEAAPADGICVSNGVYEQLIGKLTIGSQDLGKIEVKNIPRPIHAHLLDLEGTGGTHGQVPANPRASRGFNDLRRRPWLVAVGTAAVGLTVAVAGWLTLSQNGSQRPPPVALVPEKIPAMTNKSQRNVREFYLSAAEPKSLAISIHGGYGYAVAAASQKSAIDGALKNCNIDSARNCETYAVGNTVVWPHVPPPMPPEPLFQLPNGPELALDLQQIPFIRLESIQSLRTYAQGTRARVIVMTGNGNAHGYGADDGEQVAARIGLERCGLIYNKLCHIVAVGNRLVIGIPHLFKAQSWLDPETLVQLAPVTRARVAKEYMAERDWRALAVSANGMIGIATAQPNEATATALALQNCNSAGGSECDIAAVGPYQVERKK